MIFNLYAILSQPLLVFLKLFGQFSTLARVASTRVGPPPINLRVRSFGELTLGMAESKGLALVTLAKIEK